MINLKNINFCRGEGIFYVYINEWERRGAMIQEDIIIKKASMGDVDAFRTIVESYQKLIYNICFGILRDSYEAENAAQETFIQVYRSLPKYEYKGFKTWIGRIATNKSIDIKRKLQREIAANAINIDEVYEEDMCGKNSLEDEVFKRYEAKYIMDKCELLPDIYSTVIEKYYIQEKSYAEISKEELISVKAVESRLYRGKKLLKQSIKEDG